jgi:uncharacterized iron-regulated membrane protein
MFKILLTHRWLSLVLGLPMALVALTGMPLALWEEADAIFAPNFYPSTPASAKGAADRAISVVKARHPGIALDFIYFPRASSAMHVGGTTSSGEQIEVAVDGSGQLILGTRSHSASTIGQIHAFHSEFFAGDAGRWLMLAFAWVLFVSTATGVWMWLVQRRLERASLKMTRTPSRAKVLHNVIGIWSSGLLLTMALTTIVLTWPDQPETLAHVHTRHSPTAPMAGRIAHAVEIHAGTMKLRSISLRAPPDAPARAIVENSAGIMRIMMVDIEGGAVIAERPLAVTSTDAIARGLHGGSAFGHAGRWFMAGASLLPITLFLTGLSMFTRRRCRKRR